MYAGITASGGQDGVVIAAGSSDEITLRGLAINGLSGNNGIRVDGGGKMYIENVTVTGFATGVNVQPSNGASVSIFGSRVSANAIGIGVAGNASVGVVIDKTAIVDNGSGVAATADGRLAIRNSQIANSSAAGVGLAAATTTLAVTIDRSILSGNGDSGVIVFGTHTVDVAVRECAVFDNAYGLAVEGGSAPSTLRLHKSTLTRNGIGIFTAGSGSLFSAGNNTIENNGVDGAPTGAYAPK